MVEQGEREEAARLGSRLEQWYGVNGRQFEWRTWTDVFRLAVAELFLQRTRAAVVADFLPGFLREYPDWAAVARADRQVLTDTLGPLGLRHRRTATLVALAESFLANPEQALERHPGIGQYIGRAIRVATVSSREAMVDTNFVRLLRRQFGGNWMADYRYDPRLQELALELVMAADDPRHVNWAVLDFGATVCKPRAPLCGACPLSQDCAFLGPSS